MIPLSAGFLGSVMIILDRCVRFLTLPERTDGIGQTEEPPSGIGLSIVNLRTGLGEEPSHDRGQEEKEMSTTSAATSAAAATAAAAGRGPGAAGAGFVLEVPSLTVPCGQVVGVVGSVGSGKSTFVQACLGSLNLTRLNPEGGKPVIRRSLSCGFSPQEALVVSGTVQENVLMGRAWNPDTFAFACKFAAFEHDLALFSHGKETVVGERGTTLSGGQAHRLCLARSIYGKPDILFLDSSLAAVDPKVSLTLQMTRVTHLFDRGLLCF